MRRMFLCVFCALLGCAHVDLDSLMARIDVARLLECGSYVPDWQDVGRCLGVEAMTQGLQIATQEALRAAERAREAGHGGGAEADTRHAARELDAALDRLAVEIVEARRR